MNISECAKELQFVLLTTVKDMSDVSVHRAMELYNSGLDKELITRLSFIHKLAPNINANIRKFGIASDIVFEGVLKQANEYAIKSMILGKTLAEVLALFDSNSVGALSIKGPVLAQKLYGNISMRRSGDLDILIRDNDFEKAVSLLEGIGFVNYDGITTPRRKKYYFAQKDKHHFEMLRGDVCVELHWRTDAYSRSSFDNLSNNDEYLKFFGVDVLVPEKYSYLYYLINHGSKHGYMALRWLVDIYEIINSDCSLDLNVLYSYFKKNNVQHLFLETLMLLDALDYQKVEFVNDVNIQISRGNDVILVKIPGDSQDLTDARKIFECAWIGVSSTDKDIRFANMHDYAYIFKNVMVNRGNVDMQVEHFSIGPTELDFRAFNIPDSLFFLYYPLRWIYWLWRLTPFYKGPIESRNASTLIRSVKKNG